MATQNEIIEHVIRPMELAQYKIPQGEGERKGFVDIYRRVLATYSARQLKAATTAVLGKSRYTPKPYDFVRAIEENKKTGAVEPVVFDEDDPWKSQKETLMRILGPDKYGTWLKDMELEALYVSGKVTEPELKGVTLRLPNKFMVDYVRNAWAPTFDKVFHARVRFTVAEKE